MIITNNKERKREEVKIEKLRQNKQTKKDKNLTKGITLIALVITIIVLLILAGVAIAMITGENGILNKSNSAKTETVNKGALEKVQLAIAGSFDDSGKTDDGLLKTNLGNVEGMDKTKIPETITYPFTVVVDGVNIEITKDSNGYAKAEPGTGGDIPTPPVSEIQPGEIATGGNKNYVESGKIAVIPQGFKVSDVDGEKKIDTGLVVIGPDKSEFVWIPVDKNTLCVDGTAEKEIAEVATGSDYRGQLYDFSGTSSTKRTYDDIGYREPDVVTNSDSNTTYLNAMNSIIGTAFSTVEDFKIYLQEEYNNVIGSIKTNGGYYVGRYESSITGSTDTAVSATGNIQSKKGVMPTSAGNSGTNMWYGLYAKQKVYSSTLSGIDTNLKSGMITGSTYDGMLNFALNGSDKEKITRESNQKRGPEKTGAVETDKINNIYDLENNLFEWTSEAYGSSLRLLRR